MKRIAILTAGGDTPALNATIAGAVTRSNQLKIEIIGLIKGFNCLFNPRVPHVLLNPLFQEIPELDPTKGGSLIGSSRDFVDPNKKDDLDLVMSRLATFEERCDRLLTGPQADLALVHAGSCRIPPLMDGSSLQIGRAHV